MIEYIIIAILQGLLEWLPISSSGQVMIFSIYLLDITPEQAYSLSIWLHLGTTLAVLTRFKSDFIKIGKSFLPAKFDIEDLDIKKRNWIIIATIGSAITALPLYFLFRILLVSEITPLQGDIITLFISGLLIITGIILLLTKKLYGEKTIEDISQSNLRRNSFLAGLMQGIVVLPGISRSGITVSTILFEIYNHDDALRLSFLMSVPVSIASIIVDIIFGQGSIFGYLDPLTIILITSISFFVGYLTIEFLLKITQRINFGYFCIIYGLIAYIIIIPFIIFST